MRNANKQYQHKSTLETSLEGIDSQPVEQCSSTSLDISNKESGICKKCFPVLSHYKENGNAGKISNSAKSSIMEDFLSFVDTNSQPNGGSSDFTGPTSYFLSSLQQSRHQNLLLRTMKRA